MTIRAAAVLVFVVAPTLAAAETRVPYSPAEYLKNFALSICLADGFTPEEVHKDSLAAAGGYSQLGSLPLEAYAEAETLARQFLAKTYESPSGDKLTLMKCIDLFHSKELDRITTKYYRR